MALSFSLHELTHLHDPYLLPWLDLYESAFPPDERVPVSAHLRSLLAFEQGTPPRRKLWALIDDQGGMLGMAQASWIERWRLVYLGYIAIQPEYRGQGLGSAFFQRLLPELQSAHLGQAPEFVLFDVERPDCLPDPAARQMAERRIGFYERLGAVVLPGVTFYWGKAIQRMMFFRFTPLDDSEIEARTASLLREFGGELRPDEA